MQRAPTPWQPRTHQQTGARRQRHARLHVAIPFARRCLHAVHSPHWIITLLSCREANPATDEACTILVMNTYAEPAPPLTAG